MLSDKDLEEMAKKLKQGFDYLASYPTSREYIHAAAAAAKAILKIEQELSAREEARKPDRTTILKPKQEF